LSEMNVTAFNSLGIWPRDYTDDFQFSVSPTPQYKFFLKNRGYYREKRWYLGFHYDQLILPLISMGLKEYFLSDCQVGMLFPPVPTQELD